MRCSNCKTDENVAVSRGPGRKLGPIARSIVNVELDLPDDFEYPYCTKCNTRILTPAVKASFAAIEDQLESQLTDSSASLGDRARQIVDEVERKQRRAAEEIHRESHQRQIDSTEAILEEVVVSEAYRGSRSAKLIGVAGRCLTFGKQPHPGRAVLTCDLCIAFKERLESQGLTVRVVDDGETYNLIVSW